MIYYTVESGHKMNEREYGCPVEATLHVIGGKWKPLILFYLLRGTRRFNELHRLVPHATQQMLTLQLRELERDGIVSRHVYAQVPPKVEYSLTPMGMSLKPILDHIQDWGMGYITQQTGQTEFVPPPLMPEGWEHMHTEMPLKRG